MVARTRTHNPQHSDPFALVLAPPEGETPPERQKRLLSEQEEKRVSDQIDEDLRKERSELKRKSKREVKVLLLGQSESGKSTVLKSTSRTSAFCRRFHRSLQIFDSSMRRRNGRRSCAHGALLFSSI